MHLSTHNWMRAEPLEVTLRRIKKFGYESIEISGEPTMYKTKETRALLKEYGIRCWGAVTLTLGERNLAARDEGQRARSVQYVKDVLTMVSELEGKIITLVPATVGKVVPDGTEAEEWKWVVDATKECFTHAKKVGVKIAVEPLNRFETYLFNRCAQALALADAVSPEVGVCLDAFHLNIEEDDMYDAIRLAGKRLFDFHIADNNRFACGLGQLNWKKIIGTLKDIGYKGAVTNEFVAPADRTPAVMYRNMIDRNPVDIPPEQLKFIQDHGSSILTEEFYTDQMRITAQTILPLIGKKVPAVVSAGGKIVKPSKLAKPAKSAKKAAKPAKKAGKGKKK
jgi:sugar phosphate isomerase/epimerase